LAMGKTFGSLPSRNKKMRLRITRQMGTRCPEKVGKIKLSALVKKSIAHQRSLQERMEILSSYFLVYLKLDKMDFKIIKISFEVMATIMAEKESIFKTKRYKI